MQQITTSGGGQNKQQTMLCKIKEEQIRDVNSTINQLNC